MKPRRAAVLLLTAAVTLSAWAAAGQARGAAAQELRVAIVIPRSGEFSLHNRLIANGATIAADEIKTPVRLALKVVSVAPTASPRTIVHRLLRASTRVLILPCNIALEESLAREAAKAGLLALSPCNPDPALAKSLPRYWPTGMTGSAEAAQLVFYAKYRRLAKTAFLLGAAHTGYARQLTSELRAFAKRDKIKVVGAATISSPSQGIVRLAKEIRDANPAVVFAAVASPTIEPVISELRQQGVTSAFFVTDGMDAGINLGRYQTGPGASTLENVVFSTFGFPRPTSARFSRDYQAAFAKEPVDSSFPGLGYQTVAILEAAARRAAALTPDGLNASFAKGFAVKGVVLEDVSYKGHGHRLPATVVGLAEVIRDAYVALFTSPSGHPTG